MGTKPRPSGKCPITQVSTRPGETRHLRVAIREFINHYHEERNHQRLGNELIEESTVPANYGGEVHCNERLGGLLRYYHRESAT